MIKNLMPYIAKLLSSNFLLRAKRLVNGKPNQLKVFIAASDPYSYLLVQVLPELMDRFELEIKLHTVKDLNPEMFPDFQKWQSNALQDAQRLASLYKLNAPESNTHLNNQNEIEQLTYQLLQLEQDSNNLNKIELALRQFWQGKTFINSDNKFNNDEFTQQLDENQCYLNKLGHYFAGTVYCSGEWYWGLDRLFHLEQRLNHQLAKTANGLQIKYNRQASYLDNKQQNNGAVTAPIEMYYSARSPYSYLGLELAVKLAKQANVKLEIKPVLPMMMRNMAVPLQKKMYIFHDTKREANKHAIPYGYVADPLGQAVEYCYGIYSYAKQQGKEIDFLLQFGRAVNSEGIRADQHKGLKLICQRADLDWAQASKYLNDQSWRQVTSTNLEQLNQLGLWGVPCFKYKDTVVWGQDRLWAIADAITRSNND